LNLRAPIRRKRSGGCTIPAIFAPLREFFGRIGNAFVFLAPVFHLPSDEISPGKTLRERDLQ